MPRYGHRVGLYQPNAVETRRSDEEWLRRARIPHDETELVQKKGEKGSLPRDDTRGSLARRRGASG
jgi:hypothetical protein